MDGVHGFFLIDRFAFRRIAERGAETIVRKRGDERNVYDGQRGEGGVRATGGQVRRGERPRRFFPRRFFGTQRLRGAA